MSIQHPAGSLIRKVWGEPHVLHFFRHLPLLILVYLYVYNIKPNSDLHQKRHVVLDFTAENTA
jgi:hypothetical protein